MNYRHVYMLIIEHAKSEQRLGLRPKNNPEKLENLKKLKREQSSKCHWWTNGIQETFSEKCPDGWSKGRLGFKNNQEYKQKRANIMKGRVFWNNGLISIRSIDCPGPSFVRGRLKKVNIN